MLPIRHLEQLGDVGVAQGRRGDEYPQQPRAPGGQPGEGGPHRGRTILPFGRLLGVHGNLFRWFETRTVVPGARQRSTLAMNVPWP